MIYRIQDTEGRVIMSFKNLKEALDAKKFLNPSGDWRISRTSTSTEMKKKSTQKQKDAISFCEELHFPKFEGNIENFIECSQYLALYLEDAKCMYEEIACEYEAAME